MGRRQPNRRPKIYKGADGWYHCYITVGQKDDGSLDRRHVRGKTAGAVAEKVEALEAKLRQGHTPKVGTSPTLADWLEHWLTVVAARKCRPLTLMSYQSKIRHRIIPALGQHKLAKLRSEHVEAFYAGLEGEVAPATALQIHRILSRSLKVATQRGMILRNPCELVDAPSVRREEVEPLEEDDVTRVLGAVVGRRNRLRWWVALGLGLRQGEALGLRWADVDLDRGALSVRRALARLPWRHGCGGTCGKLPRSCPDRTGGGLVLEEPKSSRSRRTLALAPVLVDLFREHRRQQLAERMASGPVWEDNDLVFAQPNGRPINPRADWGEWKRILADAGVRDARLHDARHSAASLMIAEGFEAKDVQEWLGHSQVSLTLDTYTHVLKRRKLDQAQRIGAGLAALQPFGATTDRSTGTDGRRSRRPT